MTRITTFLKNPYWADWDDIVTNIVNESLENVTDCLRRKGYAFEDGHWIDKSDPDDLRWVCIAPFEVKVEKLDDVI